MGETGRDSEEGVNRFDCFSVLTAVRKGWCYRASSLFGTTFLSMIAVFFGNQPAVQSVATTYVPLLWRLDPTVLTGSSLRFAMALTAVASVGSLIPLFTPRPRRPLDTIITTQKRVLVAGCALASLGFFEYSYRLPRTTLAVAIAIQFVALPAWFLVLRHPLTSSTTNAVLVGDDRDSLAAIEAQTPLPIVGYVTPTPREPEAKPTAAVATDGGGLPDARNLGGLSRLDRVLVDHDIDTVVLSFCDADAEFFAVLDTCYDHGVTTKVHPQHVDCMLTDKPDSSTLFDVELKPRDVFARSTKRLFDVAFASVGSALAAPLFAAISLAIKLEDGGSILHRREGTGTLGDTFRVYTFRTTTEDTGSTKPIDSEMNPHTTRVGGFLRKTHLDSLPKLLSILRSDMSVVGPRPERPELDEDIQQSVRTWQQRWFVRPGLTGLAQINDVASTDPAEKLRYDVAYIRNQSFWFDLRILLRQLWMVFEDAISFVR